MENVKINVASFEDGEALQRAFFEVVRTSGFKLSDLEGEGNLDHVSRLAMSANSDKALSAALWPCLARCTYNGEKITKATFEDVDARRSYFPIIAKCIQVNVEPFLAGLGSVLGMFHSPIEKSGIQKL